MVLTILMEEYSINARITSYAKGNTSRFLNFRDVECPICRECHGNQWSLSNSPGYKRSTMVQCHKTGHKRVIMCALPF